MKPSARIPTFLAAVAAVALAASPAWAVNPVSPNASPEARMVLDYVYGQFGKKVMAAQHGSQTQYDYVQQVTGKYAAIWGTDLIMSSGNDQIMTNVIGWWAKGVIPTIMWHWGAPTKGEGYQQSMMTIDVNLCFQTGTAENTAMMADLKRIADNLARLRDAKVPVLWLPLHECSGGWFWWDKSGGPAFVQLDQTMFSYFTKDRGLDNLIWVQGFDGSPSAAYYAGTGYVDIIGSDTYDGQTTSHLSMFNSCKVIGGPTMPIAFHECGIPPDPANCQKDGAMWSWFMVWYSFIQNVDQTYLKTVYTSDLVLTLDELPNWSTRVVAYESADGGGAGGGGADGGGSLGSGGTTGREARAGAAAAWRRAGRAAGASRRAARAAAGAAGPEECAPAARPARAVRPAQAALFLRVVPGAAAGA